MVCKGPTNPLFSFLSKFSIYPIAILAMFFLSITASTAINAQSLMDTDIGNPSPAGSASLTNGVWTQIGGGTDICCTSSDQFNYNYEATSSTSQTAIARVTNVQNTATGAKAGLMFRQTTAANSIEVALVYDEGKGVELLARSSTGGTAAEVVRNTSTTLPVWLKLEQSGTTYTAYTSSNGSSWTTLGSTKVTLSNNATVGMAVSSKENGTGCTVTFDNVSLPNSTPAPDFSISASPSSQAVTAGNGTAYTATVSPVNGFSGTVSFSVSGLPSGANGSFDPASVSGSGNSTLNVTTASSTTAGAYTLTITGTSGSLTHSVTVSLIVNGPASDFSISASPSSQTVTAGNDTAYTATVSPVNGFSGTVSFSVSGLPSGANGSFNPPSVSGSGNSTLNVTTATSTTAGTYALTITGTSGSLTHSATVSLVVNTASGGSATALPVPPIYSGAQDTGLTLTCGGTMIPAYNPSNATVNKRSEFGPVSFAWMAASGPINCTFSGTSSNWMPLSSAWVAYPSTTIASTVSGNQVSFTLPGPGHYYLKPRFSPSAPTETLLMWVEDSATVASSPQNGWQDVTKSPCAVVKNSSSAQDSNINACISAAGSNGTLWFPSGTYQVSGLTLGGSHYNLVLAPGACIQGQGANDPIKFNGASYVSLSGQGCVDANGAQHIMEITGSAPQNITVNGILMANSVSLGAMIDGTGHTISNVKIFSGVDGIDPGGVTSNNPGGLTSTTFQNNTIISEDDAFAVKAETNGGGKVDTVTMKYNIVTSAKSSLKVGTATYDPISNVLFDHNDVVDGMKGIVVYACFGGTLNGVAYQNNRLFMTNRSTESESGAFIELQNYTSKCTSTQVPTPMNNISVTNVYANALWNSLYNASSTYPATVTMSNVTLNVDSPKSSGVYLFSLDSSHPNLTLNGSGLNIGWQGNQPSWSGIATGPSGWFNWGNTITQSSGSVSVPNYP